VASPAKTELEENLGYTFKDRELLRRALSHRSRTSEDSNERLEFLGDAVLTFVVTAVLFSHVDLDEGEMTKVRVSLVNRGSLVEVARSIDVGTWVRLGSGEEQAGGRRKASILADTMEALLGAVYLDGGLEKAQLVILQHWEPLISDRITSPGEHDYKTRLQEVLAKTGNHPEYLVKAGGPEHARVFTASVSDGETELGHGMGTSKKRAEQEAARRALLMLPDEIDA
jgi:ribonuclease-3